MAKSLVRTIGEGTLWTTGSTIILKVVGLATTFLILHRLSVYEYGLVELVLSIVPLLGFFLLPGLNNMVIADIGVARAQGNSQRVKTIFVHYVTVQTVLAVIAWAIVFFGADVISKFYEGQAPELIKIVSFMFLAGPIRTSLAVLFRSHLNFFALSVHAVLVEVFKLGFLVVAFYVMHLGVAGVLWAGFAGEIIGAILMAPAFYSVYRKFSGERLEHISFWKLLAAHGKWSVFASYLNSFGQNMRLWIIKAVLGTEAVGLFAVAFGLFSHTASLVPLGTVMGPVLPEYLSNRERLYKIVAKGAKYQLAAFVGLGIIGWLVFTPLVALLFPKYTASLPLFNLMLLALIPLAFASVFTPLFFALKAQRSLFFAIGVKNIAILVFAPFFMWAFGILGLGIELLLTTTVFVLERYRVLRRILPGFALSWRYFVSVDQDDRAIVLKFLRRLGVKG